jgi:hypothetical protein
VHFMISGLARSWERGDEERSQVVPIVWTDP